MLGFCCGMVVCDWWCFVFRWDEVAMRCYWRFGNEGTCHWSYYHAMVLGVDLRLDLLKMPPPPKHQSHLYRPPPSSPSLDDHNTAWKLNDIHITCHLCPRRSNKTITTATLPTFATNRYSGRWLGIHNLSYMPPATTRTLWLSHPLLWQCWV